MSNRSQSGNSTTIRADAGTFIGFLAAVGCVVGGLAGEGGNVADISQATAALIVLGGTFGAVLMTTPFAVFRAALRRLSQAFVEVPQPFERTLKELLGFAESARKSGLASLEDHAAAIQDPFLLKAANLLADGIDLPQFRGMMSLDLEIERDDAEMEIRVWENAAGYAPTIGIIGAVLGLIQVMKHLENLDDVGRGIAVAFVATVYGVGVANLFFLPLAGKLRSRSQERERLHEMMLEGLVAIAEGLNPILIRVKLTPFLPHVRAPRASAAVRPPAPAVRAGESKLVSP